MGFLAAGALALRAGRAVTHNAAGLPWKRLQCQYTTRQKKVTNIIRWNTENKMLFGAKQKPAPATRRKAAQSDAAPGSSKPSPDDHTTSTKTKTTKSRKKQEALKPTTPAADSTDSVSFSQASDGGGEWWDEDRASGNPHRESDMLSAENKHYNTLLDSGQGYYEGCEDDSSHSWSSRRVATGGGGVDIPQLLPIPGSLNIDKHGSSAASRKTTQAQKKTSRDVSLSAANFQGAEVIQKFPLLPSEFEGEVCSSAEEFKSFVDSLKLRLLPTVNTVLNKTRPDLSSFFLQRWREKMIGELGEDGFRKHQEATIWAGTNLHACIQQFLSGLPLSEIEVPEKNRGHWESISSVLGEVSEIQAVETSVSHPWLCYKGTFDCVAKYRNTLYVIDWKTSSKPKPLLSNLYDNPLQVAAYLGAINMTPDLTEKFGVVDQAAIIVAYGNGESAHVHRIQPALCQHYWREWCQRLTQYWTAVAHEKGGYTQ